MAWGFPARLLLCSAIIVPSFAREYCFSLPREFLLFQASLDHSPRDPLRWQDGVHWSHVREEELFMLVPVSVRELLNCTLPMHGKRDQIPKLLLMVYIEIFTTPSILPAQSITYSNQSISNLPSDLTSSCFQAASDANSYTTQTTEFLVGTETYTATNVDIVSSASFVPDEECCQTPWCEITASRVGIIYWPPVTAKADQELAQHVDSLHTKVSDGFTL